MLNQLVPSVIKRNAIKLVGLLVVILFFSDNRLEAATGPTIVSQPWGHRIWEGSNVLFSVQASGTDPLFYQWSYKGAAIGGSTQSIFAITNVQAAQGGFYSVQVSNAYGLVTSAPALLIVKPFMPANQAGWGIYWDSLSEAQYRQATGVVVVASRFGHSLCALQDGSVLARGENRSGESNVPFAATNVMQVAAGWSHSIALRSDGSVIQWGDTFGGGLVVPSDLTNVVAIGAEGTSGWALKGDGTIFIWNPQGKYAVAGVSNVVDISTGEYAGSLALKDDGTVIAFDDGVAVSGEPAGLSNVVAVSAGGAHFLALKSDGTVVVWGDNNYGQTNMPPDLSNVVAISAGDSHSLALKSDGSVVGWGKNDHGESSVPHSLSGAIAICAGSSESLALSRLPVFGFEPSGQLSEVGANTSYSIFVTGGDPATYQWQLNGTNIIGATNVLLTLTNLQPPDSGDYTFIASNIYGVATSSPAFLLLNPKIIQDPQDVVVGVGQTATLHVEVTGTPPFLYHWLRNNFPIATTDGPNLVLSDVQAWHAGSYSVNVAYAPWISGGVYSQAAKLTVLPVLNTSFFENDLGKKIMLSWDTIGGSCTLQSATNLGPSTVWTDYPLQDNPVLIPMSEEKMFFRLKKP